MLILLFFSIEDQFVICVRFNDLTMVGVFMNICNSLRINIEGRQIE